VVRLALVLLAGLAVACGAREPRALPDDPATPLRYVALGDSTVEGVGASRPETTYVSRLTARLRTVYPAAQAVNLGVAGATSADVLAGQLPRAVALDPHLVTLSVGPNDITRGVPVERFERHLAAILDRLAAETRAVVVVNLIPDLAVTPRFRGSPAQETVGRLTVAFNEALRRQAARHGVTLVDLYHPSRAEVPARPGLVAHDGYHPSDAGYARWAELMWAGIRARLGRRARDGSACTPC